jgi:hypothetical protein
MSNNWKQEHQEKLNLINQKLDEMGVRIVTEFVPFSKSRNAKENPKVDDMSINWKVTLKRGNQGLTTDYMQGIGHLPEGIKLQFNDKKTIAKVEPIKYACETGKIGYYSDISNCVMSSPSKKTLKQPLLIDVLYSLLLDAEVLDYSSFEDWADEMGFDPDSRKDEKVYNACMKIALQMRKLFSDNDIEILRELFQDY